MKHPTDTDLDFLYECNNDELEFLVNLIIDIGGKTNRLNDSANYRNHRSDPAKYVGEIIEEIQRYSANTVATIWRHGVGVSYREALKDTLSDLGVGFDNREDVVALEDRLLHFGLPCYLRAMRSEEDREAFRQVLELQRKDAVCCANNSFAMKKVAKKTAVEWLFSLDLAVADAVTGRARRVEIPAVIYIASLRKRHQEGGL